MKEKKYEILLVLLLFVFCFAASIFVYINCNLSSYKYMFLLPIVFFFCYSLFLRKGIKHFKEFNIVYSGINFVRFVLLPILIVITGRYGGRSPQYPLDSSFNLAFLLMIIELFSCSLFIFILSKLKKFHFQNLDNKTVTTPKTKLIYIIFIAIVFMGLLIKPNLLKAFSFIIPNSNMLTYDNFEIFDQILLLSMIAGKQLIFLLICSKYYNRFIKTNKKIYMYLAGFAMLINCFIYFGYNRSDFLMNLIASFIILIYMFGKNSKKFIKIFVIVGLVCLTLITQVRNHRSISQGNDPLYDLTDNIQIYLAGPYDIAIAVETAKEFPEARNFKHLIFDFGRSTLGLNVIFKNFNLVNSNKYYNVRLFRTEQSTQIMPIIGEGYFFFGFMFSPLIEMLFIWIAYLLRKYMDKAMRIELIFFFTITIIRIGFISGQNASIQMNDLSFNLILPMLLFFLNNLFYYKKSGERI